jgi:hypothetical protein
LGEHLGEGCQVEATAAEAFEGFGGRGEFLGSLGGLVIRWFGGLSVRNWGWNCRNWNCGSRGGRRVWGGVGWQRRRGDRGGVGWDLHSGCLSGSSGLLRWGGGKDEGKGEEGGEEGGQDD